MIPRKVKVGGIEYKVAEVEGMEEQFSHLGQVLYTKGIINIDKDMSLDRKEQVFVHELLHACFYEAGIDTHDEDLVNRVSLVLYQVLKENNFLFGEVDPN